MCYSPHKPGAAAAAKHFARLCASYKEKAAAIRASLPPGILSHLKILRSEAFAPGMLS